jgi:hypothetical protein
MRFFNAALRALTWLALGLLIIALLIWAACRFSPDEKLMPEIQTLLDAKTRVAPEKNAYYAMWGLGASPEMDAHQVGVETVAAYTQHLAELHKTGRAASMKDARFDSDRFLGENPLKIKSGDTPWCNRDSLVCLASYLDAREVIDAAIIEKRVYLDRYRALRQYLSFAETMPANVAAPFPRFTVAVHLSSLVDAGIAFSMAQKSIRAEALAELNTEVALWRRVNLESTQIFSKMIALAILERKYRLTSDLIAKYPEIVSDHRAAVETLTQPLTLADTNMRRAFEGEFRTMADTFLDLGKINPITQSAGIAALADSPSLMDSDPFSGSPSLKNRVADVFAVAAYKPNASVNGYYMYLQGVNAVNDKPAHEVLNATVPNTEYSKGDFTAPKFWLYNPTGKILTAIAIPMYNSYTLRAHDLAGRTRLLELQRQIALNKIPTEKIGEFLDAREEALRDPYTLKPMTWDASKQRISFAPQSLQSQRANTSWVQLVP